jgi:hypothetical protein
MPLCGSFERKTDYNGMWVCLWGQQARQHHGVSEPLSIYVNTRGPGKVDDAGLETVLRDSMSLTPRAIREYFALNQPIYAGTGLTATSVVLLKRTAALLGSEPIWRSAC